MASQIYKFDRFRLDVAERLLYDGDAALALPPKVFDTLVLFVENAGRVLSKEKMLAEVWEDAFVEENNLAQNISHLRRVLGTELIETVPKYGYRFSTSVTADGDAVTHEAVESVRARVYIRDAERIETEPPTELSGIRPRTNYASNGDVNIAYQVVGDGPIDIVFVMGWVSHLEYFWRHHTFASFLEKLSSFARLIVFDKRGTGLSDRVPVDKLPTLEQRMEDVHTVMDAVGSERAVLVGVSEGGPMCSLFAATYPERTAGLVMIGTYAKRVRDHDNPWAPTTKERESFLDVMRRDWGGPVGIEDRAPTLAEDPEFRRWWGDYLRNGASPGAAIALTRMNAQIDVCGVLPLIRVPTIVIHRSGDRCLKVEEGRFVASQIPDAKFIELDGIDHLPFVGDQTKIIDEIEKFVTGVRFAGEYDRVLATVMSVSFADPAGEMKHRGDADWSRFVTASRTFMHRQLGLFRGREVSVGDDETLAAFDGPARAIRCAMAVADAAAAQGVTLRIGLHTGECEVSGGTYGGFAVELAQRVAGVSSTGNIIVSRTVKDLVAGSGLVFNEIGEHKFDGIDGAWRLFEVVS